MNEPPQAWPSGSRRSSPSFKSWNRASVWSCSWNLPRTCRRCRPNCRPRKSEPHTAYTSARRPSLSGCDVVDDRVQIMADVAPEAPTVKGFVGILVDVFSQGRAAEVLAVEPDLVHRLGLSEALGMMRMRGLNAILFYIRKQVQQQLPA